ncbi:SDR family oxidoreductase [Virgibacillus xinjiangensis]|uniref:SDR family oxidoreductase n=1 Tax=Virgibacillus xinjiangensis TaxID=393090 RepID=A0ABV7CU04_9BACI
MELTGKTAIITGASAGIGQSIAEHLAEEGANVVLAARSAEKLEAISESINTREGGKAIAVQTDVTDKTAVDRLFKKATEEFGDIDIYVNNAGLVLSSAITDREVGAWDKMIDVNIKGVLYGIDSVLPQMLDRSQGHIVNIDSVSGHEVNKSSAVYAATKYAVRAISESLEKELARTGVKVSNISPGRVDTERVLRKLGDDPKRKPLKPADVARAVIYAVTQPDYVNVNEIIVRPV